MLPNENGRFCNHCQHAIVDFSRMSNVQVLEIMAKPDAPKCGRWHKSQLNTVLRLPQLAEHRIWPRLAVGAMLVLATMPHALLAQAPAKQVETVLPSGQTIYNNPEALKKGQQEAASQEDSVIFTGKVVWRETGDGAEFLVVKIKDRAIGCMTDEDGNFKLQVPRGEFPDHVLVQVYEMGNDILFEEPFMMQDKHVTILVEREKEEFLLGVMIRMTDEEMEAHRRANKKRKGAER